MPYDLLHIQGKPYVLVPLHEYRALAGGDEEGDDLPDSVRDELAARQVHPVRILRRHRRMTQDRLAAAASLSRPYLAEIEAGRKRGSVPALQALAEALGVRVGLLVESVG